MKLKGIAMICLILVVILIFRWDMIRGPSYRNNLEGDVLSNKVSISGLIPHYSDIYKTGFYLYTPEEIIKNPETKLPLVIHFHGANARGNGKEQLIRVKRHGLRTLIKKAEEYNFFVLAPQAWSDYPVNLEYIIQDLLKEYQIDENKIYLTGVSMGGNGTWGYSLTHLDQLAAIVPICSNYYLTDVQAKGFDSLPIWVFHGANDLDASVTFANKNVNRIKKINRNIKYTVYEREGHAIWDKVYETNELYEWMLKQSKD